MSTTDDYRNRSTTSGSDGGAKTTLTDQEIATLWVQKVTEAIANTETSPFARAQEINRLKTQYQKDVLGIATKESGTN